MIDDDGTALPPGSAAWWLHVMTESALQGYSTLYDDYLRSQGICVETWVD